MRRRRRAGDLEDPDELAVVVLALAEVVQRVLRSEAELAPDAVGHQAIQPRALVHLVEVRQRLPSYKTRGRSS